MSLNRAISSGVVLLHGPRHRLELAVEELLAQLVHQLLEALGGGGRHEVVRLQGLDLAGQVGREEVELHAPLGHGLAGDVLAAGVARLPGLAVEVVDGRPLRLHHLPQGLGDVVVDAAQVVLGQLLLPPLAEALDQLPQAGQAVAVGVAQPVLEQAAEGGVELAVVEEVVGELGQQGVGVELEALLGAVPPGVAERAGHARALPAPVRGPGAGGVLVEAAGQVEPLQHQLHRAGHRARRLAAGQGQGRRPQRRAGSARAST